MQKNWINDLDYEVAALFTAMRDQCEELCNRVLTTTPTVDLWKEIKTGHVDNVLDAGFRTLFLNRTSFSGILTGNPIGGMKQESKYKIDCRWNPSALVQQVRACSQKLQGVVITSLDFEEVIKAPGEGVLLYLDPPYFHKGNLLYREGMTQADHERLAATLRTTSHRFFITYDDCSEVRSLYQDWANLYPASWFYSSSNKKEREVGHELFVSNFRIKEQMTLMHELDSREEVLE